MANMLVVEMWLLSSSTKKRLPNMPSLGLAGEGHLHHIPSALDTRGTLKEQLKKHNRQGGGWGVGVVE